MYSYGYRLSTLGFSVRGYFTLEWIKPNFNKHQFIYLHVRIRKDRTSWYFQEISQINLETDIYSCTVKVCRHRLCVLLLFQIFITKVLETILVPQLAVSKNQIYFILILVPRITFSLINYVFLPILRQLDLPDFYALFHQYICSICNLIHYFMQLFYFCFLFLCNSGNVGEEHTKKKRQNFGESVHM